MAVTHVLELGKEEEGNSRRRWKKLARRKPVQIVKFEWWRVLWPRETMDYSMEEDVEDVSIGHRIRRYRRVSTHHEAENRTRNHGTPSWHQVAISSGTHRPDGMGDGVHSSKGLHFTGNEFSLQFPSREKYHQSTSHSSLTWTRSRREMKDAPG